MSQSPLAAAVAIGAMQPCSQIHVQLWTAMRSLSGFTVGELKAIAATDECPVKKRDAALFMVKLARAGIIVPVGQAKTLKGLQVSRLRDSQTYRLLPSRNTGPRPPHFMFAALVYDPNAHCVVGTGGPRSP